SQHQTPLHDPDLDRRIHHKTGPFKPVAFECTIGRLQKTPRTYGLLMTAGARTRGGKGPDEWKPPYEPVQTIYVQRFMAIVEKYGLALTEEESAQYQGQ
ncbi:hypothetical protein Q5Y71_14595, partial [Microbulbifer sp. 2205BS26-8]